MSGIIIAMAMGVVLGAACVIIGFNIVLSFSAKHTSSTASGTPSPQGEGFGTVESKHQELLNQQWENFLNYDGTDKDQMPIGDE